LSHLVPGKAPEYLLGLFRRHDAEALAPDPAERCAEDRLLQQGKKFWMTEERVNKLEEIGFVWDASYRPREANVDDEAWNQRYGELIEYKQKHGHCNVPFQYEPNKPLGNWVSTQRKQYRLLQKGHKSPMTTERIDKLEEIGFKWKARG